MLVVAIVLPTADTGSDVELGATLVGGTYDQPWQCVKSGYGRYLDFGDSNPGELGKSLSL